MYYARTEIRVQTSNQGKAVSLNIHKPNTKRKESIINVTIEILVCSLNEVIDINGLSSMSLDIALAIK